MSKVSPDAATWAGRRVFLTGHTGFKGSWLSLWLDRLGAEVVGYSDGEPTAPSLFGAAALDRSVTSIFGDIQDLQSLSSALGESAPSVVIHLAAQPLVRRSYEDPVATFASNVMGTVNLLEAVRRAPRRVDAVIIVTTDKCYENRGWDFGYRESDRLGGKDPYSASKAAAEIVTRSYREALFGPQAGFGVATARAGNVIGGGDFASDRLIPDIVRAATVANPRVVLRNPTAERPWQHVLDCLSGYLLLAERLLHDPGLAGPWNFGPPVGPSSTVSAVVDDFVNRLNPGITVEVRPEPEKTEELLLALDATRARRLLGWAPRLALTESIALTADWYSAYLRQEDVHDVTLGQIADYERLALGETADQPARG